ncbi:hypothetical protein ACFSR7_33940 [Cohnella sp. GCM10020058]|uniref:hypothetical protein n=1 Tax=Cohnella sp. GCM10020058 TaxID=3317330 RepID=UPI00362BF9F2
MVKIKNDARLQYIRGEIDDAGWNKAVVNGMKARVAGIGGTERGLCKSKVAGKVMEPERADASVSELLMFFGSKRTAYLHVFYADQ